MYEITDNEFRFVLNDTKLQKLAPKVWKSKDCSIDEPLLTFYFRVQHYVDNIGLLKCVLPLFSMAGMCGHSLLLHSPSATAELFCYPVNIVWCWVNSFWDPHASVPNGMWSGKLTVPPLDNSPGFPLRHFPLPYSFRVRVRSGISRVRVRVGSVGLGLVLGLEQGLGLG